MPNAIAKKLKEMKDPNYRKRTEYGTGKFDEFRKKFRPPSDDPNEPTAPIEVVIRLSSMEPQSQKKLLLLMQNIFDIGRAASEIYNQGESPAFKTYFCPVSNPIDLAQTLSSFQFVHYSEDEIPVSDSLFWPGGGTILSETLFSPTGATIYCLHHDMETVSDVWHELSKLIRNSLSTWSDEFVSVEQDGEKNSPGYCRWQAAYLKEMNDLICKIDHVSSVMPQIEEKMHAWACAWRELFIERQHYEDNRYDESEDFRYP